MPRPAPTPEAACRARLLGVREQRIPPLHDDKVLSDWNGHMIGALALAGRVLDEPRYVTAAQEAAEFVLTTLRPEGELMHRYREGEVGIPALLDDYAFMAWGLVELYQATFEPRYLREAKALLATLQERFGDAEGGGFFASPADNLVPGDANETWDIFRLDRETGDLTLISLANP